mgnify:CR=1 FL=1
MCLRGGVGCVFVASRGVLLRLWRRIKASWSVVGASWSVLGRLMGVVWASLGRLGGAWLHFIKYTIKLQ